MRLQFILSEIGLGLRRNLSMTISVILVTFVSLTFVGAAALLQQQISQMKDDWYGKVEVSVFLCPQGSEAATCASGEVTPDQVTAIKAELDSPELKPYVRTVYFETKAAAFKSFQKKLSDQPWAKAVTVNDMNSSYRVKLADPQKYQVVADVLSGRQGVEEVLDQRRIFDSLFLVLNRATLLSVGLATVMLLAAVLLITTTIRLSAMSRKRETDIMRLVGASNIRVNCVAPGNVLFPGGSWERHLRQRPEEVQGLIRAEVPLRRFGTPDEIADLVVFLASERAAFITGSCIVADGGQSRSV